MDLRLLTPLLLSGLALTGPAAGQKAGQSPALLAEALARAAPAADRKVLQLGAPPPAGGARRRRERQYSALARARRAGPTRGSSGPRISKYSTRRVRTVSLPSASSDLTRATGVCQ